MFGRRPKAEPPLTLPPSADKLSPVAGAVVDLLLDHPLEWSWVGHRGTHTGGIVVDAHLDWAVEVAGPRIGTFIRTSDVGKATYDQRFILEAAKASKAKWAQDFADGYLAQAAERRGDQKRLLLETARRAEHDAEGLRIAADRAATRAAQARREAGA